MTDHLDRHRFVRLRGCHPELIRRIKAVVADLEQDGLDIIITQGVRSIAQQQSLYAQGRSKPGKIVTNCDGVRHPSNHQPKLDGYGHAVDVAWRLPDLSISWDGPWDRLGILAEARGLTWGGYWVRFPDRCHLELPTSPALVRTAPEPP